MSKRIFYPLLLLLIPLIGMLLTDEVNWNIFDFIVMGILLLLLGFAVNFIVTKTKKFKILFITLTIIVFVLIYIELAIGVFGSPFAGS